jgi:hypothetical protein
VTGSSASSEFKEVSYEVQSLHTAITAVQDELADLDAFLAYTLPRQRSKLQGLLDNCAASLKQLEEVVQKYESLGSLQRKKRDVLKFATKDLPSLRSKLIVHTNAINVFLTAIGCRRLNRIESKLDGIIQEIQIGERNEGFLAVANEEFPMAAEAQWSLLKLELSDDGFEIGDIEAHRLWFESRIKSSSDKYRDVPSETVRNQTFWNNSFSGQIYRYLGFPISSMRGGNYVVVQTDSNARVSNPQLLLPCFTLDGRDLGSIPSTELAIVPESRVVGGQIEIQDMCDKSAAQELADLRTIDLRAKAGAYYTKRTTRYSPIDNPVSSPSEVQPDLRPSRSKTPRAEIPSRPVSRTGSVRSNISEYDGEGRLVRRKTITTTYGISDQEEQQPPPPPRHYSAPPSPPPRLERRARSASNLRTRPTQWYETVDSASQPSPRLPDTFSNSVDVVQPPHTFASLVPNMPKKGLDSEGRCPCHGDSYGLFTMLQTRTRQLRFVLIEMDRLNVRPNSRHLLTRYNDVDALDERLPEMHRQVTDLVELIQASRPKRR